jgi:hypothetical protein
MVFRRITWISIAVIPLLAVPALPAFQAARGTTDLSKSKKAPKGKANAAAKRNSTTDKTATGKANNKAASEATTTVNKSKKAPGHKMPKENAAQVAVGEVAAPPQTRPGELPGD